MGKFSINIQDIFHTMLTHIFVAYITGSNVENNNDQGKFCVCVDKLHQLYFICIYAYDYLEKHVLYLCMLFHVFHLQKLHDITGKKAIEQYFGVNAK